MGGLFLELRQALLNAHTPIDHKADFCFQTPDFSAGFIQLALGLVDLIARGVMRLPHRFQVGLNVAQISQPAFQFIDGFFSIGLDLGLVSLAFGAL